MYPLEDVLSSMTQHFHCTKYLLAFCIVTERTFVQYVLKEVLSYHRKVETPIYIYVGHAKMQIL